MELKPIYYFYGPEDLLIDERVEEIKSAALTPGFESMNFQIFHSDSLDVADLLTSAGTLPAFSTYRLLILKNAGSLKVADTELITEYVKNPSPSTVLVMISSETKPDMRKTFVKALDKSGFLVNCRRMSERDLPAWVAAEVRKYGKRISRGASTRLIASAGPRLRDLHGEIEKLTLFIGAKEGIEESDVDEAGIDLREETIFKLTEAIGGKNVEAAFRILNKLSEVHPLQMMGLVSREIRILLKVKALERESVAKQALGKRLGVPPFTVDGYVRRSRGFSEGELKGALKRLAKADAVIKSSSLPVGVVMPKLVLELCSGDGLALA
ncbi:MAG: DNA polymerase III subunit delta [Proteobacteria bacterium]|nr:DNA polymerase III subunit delta [Pseudomonadota bacterium]